jgi:Cu2+-exporting ATPase
VPETIATYIAWRSHDASRAFEVALALLVISCPCALALAVPAALAAAHSRLSRLGILVCRPDALETLARIDTFVFDKTGTLSDGAWRVRCNLGRSPLPGAPSLRP